MEAPPVTRTGATPSPWGEPARMPPRKDRMPAVAGRPARGTPSGVEMRPSAGTGDAIRWERHGRRERIRAVVTMFFVAIVLGAAAAGVLGIAVWAIAAVFRHAASG
jgi:hypothetical protein